MLHSLGKKETDNSKNTSYFEDMLKMLNNIRVQIQIQAWGMIYAA